MQCVYTYIYTYMYKHTLLKLILEYNLSAKWNETGWYFWNEMFWHYQNETRKMKWFILTLSCGKFLQNWNVPVEQPDFNKTVFLELNRVLLKWFWAAVGGAYLQVSAFVKLPFGEMKATRHVKSTIHFGKWPWIMQLHLKPESHCDKTGSNRSVKYFDMCPPLMRLPHRTSTNMPQTDWYQTDSSIGNSSSRSYLCIRCAWAYHPSGEFGSYGISQQLH